VLIVTSSYLFPSEARPGAGVFFANMLLRLRPHLADLVVVSPTAYAPKAARRFFGMPADGDLPERDTWQGIEVIRPKYLSFRARRRQWFQARSFTATALPACLALHRRRRFDLVVSYMVGQACCAAEHVARRIGARCLSWAIGSDVNLLPHLSLENRRFFQHTVRHLDTLLTNSDDLRRAVLALCPDAGRVHVNYKGIDLRPLTDLPSREACRGQLGLRRDGTFMIAAGHLTAAKGTGEFYEAFRALSAEYPRLEAIWVGAGPQAGRLETQAARDGLAERLHLPGRVDRATVFRYLRAADLMVFPSHAEGLPNVVMEAMAVGLPVVATQVGGVPEIVADGLTGLTVPPKSPEAVTAATRRLLERTGDAERMGTAAQQVILRYFDLDKNVPLLLEVFRRTRDGDRLDEPMPVCAGLVAGQTPLEALKKAAALGEGT